MSATVPVTSPAAGTPAPVGESREIRPISHASTNRRVLELVLPLVQPGTRVLDVGAGEGYFSHLLGEHVTTRFAMSPADVVHACDVHPEFFRYAKVPCATIDASGRLPYDDASFDVVCSLEEPGWNYGHFRSPFYRFDLAEGAAYCIYNRRMMPVSVKTSTREEGYWALRRAVRAGRIALSATLRSRCGSWARKTTPMPPLPSTWSTR